MLTNEHPGADAPTAHRSAPTRPGHEHILPTSIAAHSGSDVAVAPLHGVGRSIPRDPSFASAELSNHPAPVERWPEMIRAARRALGIAVGADLGDNGRYSGQAVRALRFVLPYCLHPVDDSGAVIWVNRDYTPLGCASAFADYERYRGLHVAIDDPRIAALVAACPPERGFVYLFGDGSAPWLGKAEALAYLGKLRLIDCA